jgi:hydroxymethylpyrimidine pyrophosphatase-like HAD family hydrolase
MRTFYVVGQSPKVKKSSDGSVFRFSTPVGVWVDNVTPELRDRADVIVASNNDHGVAEVVRRFILN